MTKVVIAIDSFKGCLSSIEACEAAATGALRALPEAEVFTIPLSDGGEGLTEVLTHSMHGELVEASVHGPLMEPITARYGIVEGNASHSGLSTSPTAIIEMAAACGLPLVPEPLRNPDATTTFGFGEMILDALRRGCRHLILGIGGSATNDAGMGMLQALGATLVLDPGLTYDQASSLLMTKPCHPLSLTQIQQGQSLPPTAIDTAIVNGGLLSHLCSIDTSTLSPLLEGVTIHVACDVRNPLFGPQGAAHIYAPQKGASPEAVVRLDRGLQHVFALATAGDAPLASASDANSTPSTSQPGDGAAGGLGFALRHYLGATLQPGIELVLSQLHFDTLIADADLILTGEGQSDAQTLMGKVPAGVLHHAQLHHVPVHLVAGRIQDHDLLLSHGFAALHCINDNDPSPLSELLKPENAKRNLIRTVAQFVGDLYL